MTEESNDHTGRTIKNNKKLKKIFHLLHEKTKIDFSDYKPTTINRRIQRRMMLHKIVTLKKYLVYLQGNPDEVIALQKDLLITVTSFFRDPEKYEVLAKVAFPEIVTQKSNQDPIRIWVPGCATGEEAYSIAIALTEFLGGKQSFPIQIFATDVKDAVIETAREGVYPETIVDHISQKRLHRFFAKVENGYLVNKDIRDMCVFAVHDITQNPPFSNLDFISCQNVLIYLSPELQKRVISLFHYALHPSGFLMLGNSESVGTEKKYFHLVDNKYKIYSKKIVKSTNSKLPLVDFDRLKPKNTLPFLKQEVTRANTIQMKPKTTDLLSRIEKINKLKEALDLSRKYANAIVDELNDLTEELQSANEELLINNEELQTANEELETSQEELQSANEELLSLNTELQKREEALTRLAAIVQSSDDAIISKSRTGIITSWNKGAQRLYGYTPEEIIGKSVSVLMPPGKKSDFPKIMNMLLKGKRIEHYETQRMSKDGRILDVSLTVSPLRDAKGKIIGASKIARDITERKRTEARLLQQVNLLELTYDAIFVWHLDGKITYWNKAAVDLYGFTKLEATGKVSHKLLQTIHTVEFANYKKELIRAKRWEGELQHITKQGQKIIVDSKQILLTDNTGNEIVLETNRDITQRKQIEHNIFFISEASKILSSTLDYNTTLENIAKLAVPYIADWCSIEMLDKKNELQLVSIAHKDPKKVKWAKEFRKTNPFMEVPTGLHHIMKTGKSVLFSDITEEILKKMARNEKELEILRNIGYTSAIIVPVLLNKKGIGLISFVTTETKRHYSKTDLAMAEEIASRASFAIENAILYTDAQKAVALRDEFISVASHELKTPITSLKMYTQVLKSKIEKENNISSYPLIKMDEQIKKLTNLMGDLLNVSRIQSGKLEYDKERFDLTQLVKSVIETVQPTTQIHTIILEGAIQKHVIGDKNRIGQVITNLLTNAIKYSPNAHKVIVRLTSETDVAVVSVQDFGIGIDKEHQMKIFDRFYRVSSAEERTFPGLGLGLYISYQIIQRHGGEMSVVSDKNKGSQFSFTIPYKAQTNFNKEIIN